MNKHPFRPAKHDEACPPCPVCCGEVGCGCGPSAQIHVPPEGWAWTGELRIPRTDMDTWLSPDGWVVGVGTNYHVAWAYEPRHILRKVTDTAQVIPDLATQLRDTKAELSNQIWLKNAAEARLRASERSFDALAKLIRTAHEALDRAGIPPERIDNRVSLLVERLASSTQEYTPVLIEDLRSQLRKARDQRDFAEKELREVKRALDRVEGVSHEGTLEQRIERIALLFRTDRADLAHYLKQVQEVRQIVCLD